jgi:cell filamentation protein
VAKDPKHRGDRYNSSGNPEAEYVDPARTVLVNKRGITNLHVLQVAEEEALAAAYEILLGEIRMDTPMTCDLLRHIHGRIFGDLYTWAGRWRTVWISKPGVTWPAPDYLDENLHAFDRDVLARYPAAALRDDEAFCAAVGEIEGEFLVIHPFREGNARTIKLMADLLAEQTDRPVLLYDQTAIGQEAYTAAAKAAFKKDYRPMTDIIQSALNRARKAG